MHKQSLETLSSILWRSAVLGFAVATIWFLLFIIPGAGLCGLQNSLFGLTDHECMLVTYCGVGLIKILVWVFFLCPWIAVRWFLRTQSK